MTPAELLDGIDRLGSLPEAVVRVNQLIDSPGASLAEIGEVIAHDAALSARLLRLVNSAFYGFPAAIGTVSRAIGLIGTDEVRALVVASTAVSVFAGIDARLVDMNAFWLRSVYCGLVARKVAASRFRRGTETQFLAGLLHDIGRLVLFRRLPGRAAAMLAEAEASGVPLHRIEREALGFTTAEVGAELLERWRLPRQLWEPIRCQHAPGAAHAHPWEAAALHVARAVTDRFEPELKTAGRCGDLDALPVADEALAMLGLGAAQLGAIAFEANVESLDVLGVLSPSAATIF